MNKALKQLAYMKITSEGRLQALTHEDFHVRNCVLDCCASFSQTNPQATREISKAVDVYGLDGAYDFVHKLSEFELDAELAEWLCGVIESTGGETHFERNALAHLHSWLISKGPTEFLKQNRERIASFSSDWEGFKPRDLDAELEEREGCRGLTNEALFEAIENHLQTLTGETDFADAGVPRLTRMVMALDGEEEWVRDKVLVSLRETMPGEDDEFLASDWAYGIWILAAGHLGIEEAVPMILEGMRMDWDWLNEEIPRALGKIGTDRCLEQTAAYYEDYFDVSLDEDYVRLFLSNVFESVESSLAAELACRLLEDEPDEYTRTNLATAIAVQLDGDKIGKVKEVLTEDPDYEDRKMLIDYLYTYAVLTETNPPEMGAWKDYLDEDAKWKYEMSHQGCTGGSMLHDLIQETGESPDDILSLIGEPQPSPWDNESAVTYSGATPHVRAYEKTGRNEPCPCGSGKKYKNCCMN